MATASESLFFNPLMKAGFDAGFHQFDIYKFTLENTKFFQTTRPYTELAYVIGSKAEQLLSFTHIQNKKSNLSTKIVIKSLLNYNKKEYLTNFIIKKNKIN